MHVMHVLHTLFCGLRGPWADGEASRGAEEERQQEQTPQQQQQQQQQQQPHRGDASTSTKAKSPKSSFDAEV